MIDQTSQFFAILTNIGVAKQANADALGIAWKITHLGVGDANGTDPIPDATQKALINERRRAPINQLRVDPTNSALIIAEQVIPAEVGGWWIREIGLYDVDGDLVAIANCAPSFKPLLTQGSGRTQVVRLNMLVSNSSTIELKIDPSVVLATRAYVDAKVLEEINKLDTKQSVRMAATGNISLNGIQTLDGIAGAANDRVLVPFQTDPKENGIYVMSANAWARSADADTNPEVTSALIVSVEQGTTLADTRWQLITDGPIVVGTTALTFRNVATGFARLDSPEFIGLPKVPTPPLFNNSKLIANMEALQRAMGNYSAALVLAASATLTMADVGKIIVCNSVTPITVTLPVRTSTAQGSAYLIINQGGAPVTVTGQEVSNRNIYISPSYRTSVNLAVSSSAVFTNGGDWMISGVASLPYSSDFEALLTTLSSTQKLPTGFTLQCGNINNASTAASLPLTFSKVFPTACVALILVSSNGGSGYSHQGKNAAGATLVRGSNSAYALDYIAVGY
jgi:hypothetical protein